MDKEGKLRAVEWALKRHYDGKTKLSSYQLCKIEKSILLANKNTVKSDSKKGLKVPIVSAKDLKRVGKIIKGRQKNSTEV